MNKKTLSILVAVMALGLAAVGVSRLVQYVNSASTSDTTSDTSLDTSSEEFEEPVYHRIEAEKYEIVFPLTVNGARYTVGGLYAGNLIIDDFGFGGGTFLFEDDDLINDIDGLFCLEFYVYLDSTTATLYTDNHVVLQGEYGRYLISETQVADEPVAFTLEPIYEYVLVE